MPYKNYEDNKAHSRQYYREHLDERKQYNRKYYTQTISRFKIRAHERRLKLRKQALERLGDKCCKCGFSDWRALQIDHIQGNGHAERVITDGEYFHKKIINMTEEEIKGKYQLLCANCNWIKRYEMKELKGKWATCDGNDVHTVTSQLTLNAWANP